MSTRLQVVLPDDELERFRAAATAEGLNLSDWVRRALRDVESRRSQIDPQLKIAAIRRAAQHAAPTADIEQMLAEIDAGRAMGLP